MIATHHIPDNIQVVVLDVDGTLYNKKHLSLRMIMHGLCHIGKMRAERTTRAQFKGKWIGDKDTFYQQYFAQMAAERRFSAQQAQTWYDQQYMPLMVKMIGQYHPIGDWVQPFIATCRDKGIKIVVLSDYDHVNEKLLALKLSPTLFDWVVSAPELGGLKPAVPLLQTIAKKMKVKVSDCLVIGDRDDTDGAMAKAAGASFYKVEY